MHSVALEKAFQTMCLDWQSILTKFLWFFGSGYWYFFFFRTVGKHSNQPTFALATPTMPHPLNYSASRKTCSICLTMNTIIHDKLLHLLYWDLRVRWSNTLYQRWTFTWPGSNHILAHPLSGTSTDHSCVYDVRPAILLLASTLSLIYASTVPRKLR